MSYELTESYKQVKRAQEKYDAACAEQDAELKDSYFRNAFYALYMAVRSGNMVYNSMFKGGTDAQGGTFTYAADELNSAACTLYKDFYVEGRYPKDDVERIFGMWKQRVRGFLDRLSSECPLGKNTQEVEAWVEERDHGYMRHHEDSELVI
ncbi:MAG: hypothetical protein ACOX69_04270 [Coriobacteriales bacterium]